MKLKMTILVMGMVLLFAGIAGAQIVGPPPQTLLQGATIPKFVDPLPVTEISVIPATTGPAPVAYNITLAEFQAQILPTGLYPASWVWGYLTDTDSTATPRASYLGPVVVAARGIETHVTYKNQLPYGASSMVQNLLPIDQTLDWADPFFTACVGGPPTTETCSSIYSGPQPAVPHIHGGEVAPAYDGGPDAWWLPVNLDAPTTQGPSAIANATQTGQATFIYPNEQQAGTIWFHDHALGITRLNVYAGMAGVHIITDSANEPPLAGDTACSTPGAFGGCLPNAAFDIPLIIQDRSFDTSGQLFYNLASNPQPNIGVHPYWIPEFIGDTIVVNGKTWPFLEVEPRKYRFRLLNGSNARFYDLTLNQLVAPAALPAKASGKAAGATIRMNMPIIAIATDDGYLDAPVTTPNVIIGPGERYEVVVDFAGLPVGTEIVMKNSARTPFPGGAKPIAGTTDTVMKFRVIGLNGAIPDPALPTNLRPNNPILDIKTPAVANLPVPTAGACTVPLPATNTIVRQLTLNEVIGPGGPLELVVNNTKFNGGASTFAEFGGRESEQPAVGDTEIWEIINITADAHPIHTHLASYQILNRQAIRATPWMTVYASQLTGTYGAFPDGLGPPNTYLVQNADCAIGGNPAIGAYLRGNPTPPSPYEMGWKDTAIMYPGEVTRIVIRWAETDAPIATTSAGANTYPFSEAELFDAVGYVWHCHIIDHEDNEMMRPYIVGGARQTIN